MPKLENLTQAEIVRALDGLPTWERDGDKIVTTRRFDSFAASMAFVNKVADVAESYDHHPDIDIRYSTVRLACWTHQTEGLTRRDIELARRIDALG